MIPSNRRYLTTAEVVARLGTTYERFRNAIVRGVVTRPALKIGVTRLWSETEFERARQQMASVKPYRPRKPWSGRRTITEATP